MGPSNRLNFQESCGRNLKVQLTQNDVALLRIVLEQIQTTDVKPISSNTLSNTLPRMAMPPMAP